MCFPKCPWPRSRPPWTSRSKPRRPEFFAPAEPFANTSPMFTPAAPRCAPESQSMRKEKYVEATEVRRSCSWPVDDSSELGKLDQTLYRARLSRHREELARDG